MNTGAGARAIPCPSVLREMTIVVLQRDQQLAFRGKGWDLASRGSEASGQAGHTIGIENMAPSRQPTRIDVVVSKSQVYAGSHACQRTRRPGERFRG